jgi:hypothetical protein
LVVVHIEHWDLVSSSASSAKYARFLQTPAPPVSIKASRQDHDKANVANKIAKF